MSQAVYRRVTGLLVPATVLLQAPHAAYAQDYTGNVNPSAWSGPTVMHGAISANAKRNGARYQSRATPRQAAACAQKSRFRAQFGAQHPQVRQLYRLCRGVGL